MPIKTVTNPTNSPFEVIDTSNQKHIVGAMGGQVTADFDGAQLDMIELFGAATISPPASATAPVNTVAPVITGTAQVGEELTTTNGTWTGTAPIAYTRQWLADGEDIAGETALNYTPVEGDIGKVISVSVTATNSAGNQTAVSDETEAVIAAA